MESEGAAEKLEGVLTKDELGRSQRYDTTLKIIREKARVREELYYWADNLLMRKPYHCASHCPYASAENGT